MWSFSSDSPVRIMEVCGTHTHELFRTGLRFSLPPWVKLISGPGCPVCVTDDRDLAKVIMMAREYELTVLTFGDMLKVNTEFGSLASLRSEGRKVEIVYSPVDAVTYAKQHPDERCMFVSVGFETTMPSAAVAVKEAIELNIGNLFFFVNHKLLPPALDALLSTGDMDIDGLILPGHVSAIIGRRVYEPILLRHGMPGVITGFTKDHMRTGINLLLNLVVHHEAKVLNAYPEVVQEDGNPQAKELIEKYFEPTGAHWRGLGFIPNSGAKLRPEYNHLDAEVAFPVSEPMVHPPHGCRCGDVVLGTVDPVDCPLFGTVCTPQNAVGPCMVSSEGACAAWYKYGGLRHV
ncbi:hydrogenase formation protein HypD [Coprothermobacteraceae bacterium]|nr:hydrogenase formation protein HypD [Coprothermobacteraceae bacterium]